MKTENFKKLIIIILIFILAVSFPSALSSDYTYTMAQDNLGEVLLSGNAVGIKMYMDGLLVIGFAEIPSANKYVSPGKKAGLSKGDIITHANGTKLSNSGVLDSIVQQSDGAPITLRIIHDFKLTEKKITPVYYDDACTYKLGVWIKESAAGIGTVTFIDPKTKAFAALGHGVSDNDTGTLVSLGNGSITNCNISSVSKGFRGCPGEIKGVFAGDDIGTISYNFDDGIYGTFFSIPKNCKKITVADKNSVHTGDASIYACLDNDNPKQYKIEIRSVSNQQSKDSKGIFFKVTDKELIKNTGGIVQGMSGCPIIQDGKLVGAVSHVLLNDPSMGYGVFAQWMLQSLNGKM